MMAYYYKEGGLEEEGPGAKMLGSLNPHNSIHTTFIENNIYVIQKVVGYCSDCTV